MVAGHSVDTANDWELLAPAEKVEPRMFAALVVGSATEVVGTAPVAGALSLPSSSNAKSMTTREGFSAGVGWRGI